MTKKIAEIQEEENQALKRYSLLESLLLFFPRKTSAYSCKYLKIDISFSYGLISFARA